MPPRISTDHPLDCDCGARGIATLTEDDIHERSEGSQNPVWTVIGPFVMRGDGFVCQQCGSVNR